MCENSIKKCGPSVTFLDSLGTLLVEDLLLKLVHWLSLGFLWSAGCTSLLLGSNVSALNSIRIDKVALGHELVHLLLVSHLVLIS